MSNRIPTHSWLKKLCLSYVPGPSTELAERVASDLTHHFQEAGHHIPKNPSEETDIILTTAKFGEALGWREALMFTARSRYKLKHAPLVFTIVHATPDHLQPVPHHPDQLPRLLGGLSHRPGRPDPGPRRGARRAAVRAAAGRQLQDRR